MLRVQSRYEAHKEYIEDVCLEISQASYWRGLLFNSDYNEKTLIDLNSADHIPAYIRDYFRQYDLKYYVSKVKDCPEKFDSSLKIFKFEACEYSDVICYSGNNSGVV